MPEIAAALQIDDFDISKWIETLNLDDLEVLRTEHNLISTTFKTTSKKAIKQIYLKNKTNGNTDSHIRAYIKFMKEFKDLEELITIKILIQSILTQNAPFLNHNAPFSNQNAPFLDQNAPFLNQNAPFLQVVRRSVFDAQNYLSAVFKIGLPDKAEFGIMIETAVRVAKVSLFSNH